MDAPLPPIYFGPVTSLPSWYWVGKDVAEFIARTHEVRYFSTVDDIPECGLVFWIKCPPVLRDAERIVKKNLTLVFFPVDAFMSESEIESQRIFVEHARFICLHAQSLKRFFDPERTILIDHFNKYGLPLNERVSDGKTLLWIGGFQYIPYVLSGLQTISWRRENITLLTDLDSGAGRAAAERNGRKVGLYDPIRALAGCGVNTVRWSEVAQRLLLRSCKAAFDIKFLDCFNQYHKPPTKLQKYLASGIPCAVNTGFPGADQVHGVLPLQDLTTKTIGHGADLSMTHIGQALRRRLDISAIASDYLRIAFRAAYSISDISPEQVGVA